MTKLLQQKVVRSTVTRTAAVGDNNSIRLLLLLLNEWI
jgi:hypothetical protein